MPEPDDIVYADDGSVTINTPIATTGSGPTQPDEES
jgi:hypothetical protein